MRSGDADGSPELSIATWNVERLPSRRRSERVHSALETRPADVWVLTETRPGFSPGDWYGCVTSSKPDEPERVDERWVAIWSPFPIHDLGPTSDPARSAVALIEAPSGPPLVVVGCVLPWIGSPWRGIPSAGAEAFRAALEVHADDWARLGREHPDAELVVAGDLNQDLSERHFYGSRAGREALRGALRRVGLRALSADPGDPVRAVSGGVRASVDHICVPAGSSRWASAALDVWPDEPWPSSDLSDHYGLRVAI